jgi:hypothetical protein
VIVWEYRKLIAIVLCQFLGLVCGMLAIFWGIPIIIETLLKHR